MPESRKKRTAILIAGMHRSGTSALSGVIRRAGASGPAHMLKATQHNPKGFEESDVIFRANESIYRSKGTFWDDWSRVEFSDEETERHAADLASVIKSEYKDADFIVIKDPRVCRLMPPWIAALRAAGYEPKVVLPFRHPIEVADSLSKRNGMGRDWALLMWLRHVLDAERGSRGLARSVTSYTALLADWRGTLIKVFSSLGIDRPLDLEGCSAEVDDFLAGDLRHQRLDSSALVVEADTVVEWCRDCFEAFERAVDMPRGVADLSDELDRIARPFEAGADIFSASFSQLNLARQHDLDVILDLRTRLRRSRQALERRQGAAKTM